MCRSNAVFLVDNNELIVFRRVMRLNALTRHNGPTSPQREKSSDTIDRSIRHGIKDNGCQTRPMLLPFRLVSQPLFWPSMHLVSLSRMTTTTMTTASKRNAKCNMTRGKILLRTTKLLSPSIQSVAK